MKPAISRMGSPVTEITSAIAESIRKVSAKAREVSIRPDSLLLEDLALDSLDLVAVVIELQDRFSIEIDPDDVTAIRTVGDLTESLTRELRRVA